MARLSTSETDVYLLIFQNKKKVSFDKKFRSKRNDDTDVKKKPGMSDYYNIQ